MFSEPIWAQSSLTFIGPVNYVSDRSVVGGRQLMDTVTISPGNVMKIEGVGLSLWANNTQQQFMFIPENDYLIEIDNIFLHSNENTQSSGGLYQKISLPCWIGPGTHYLYFNKRTHGSALYRLSVHGILFQTN